jgi:hypothetical protein
MHLSRRRASGDLPEGKGVVGTFMAPNSEILGVGGFQLLAGKRLTSHLGWGPCRMEHTKVVILPLHHPTQPFGLWLYCKKSATEAQ